MLKIIGAIVVFFCSAALIGTFVASMANLWEEDRNAFWGIIVLLVINTLGTLMIIFS